MWKYGLIHFTLLYLSYSSLGFIYGSIALVIAFNVFDKVTSFFGYRRLNYGDLWTIYEKEGTSNNMAGYFVLDKINFKTFKEFIVQKAVSKVPKLRSIKVFKFGFHFWKDMGLEAGSNQIVQISMPFKNEDDLMKY